MSMPLNSSQRKQFSAKSYHSPPPPKITAQIANTNRMSVAWGGSRHAGARRSLVLLLKLVRCQTARGISTGCETQVGDPSAGFITPSPH